MAVVTDRKLHRPDSDADVAVLLHGRWGNHHGPGSEMACGRSLASTSLAGAVWPGPKGPVRNRVKPWRLRDGYTRCSRSITSGHLSQSGASSPVLRCLRSSPSIPSERQVGKSHRHPPNMGVRHGCRFPGICTTQCREIQISTPRGGPKARPWVLRSLSMGSNSIDFCISPRGTRGSVTIVSHSHLYAPARMREADPDAVAMLPSAGRCANGARCVRARPRARGTIAKGAADRGAAGLVA